MFGAYFKQARESAGMSPVEMASKIGYKSADSVYRIERNAAEPSWEQADKWAQACGKLIGDILPNSGGSSLDTVFQPLLASLAGMDENEMREQILILASQARLNLNAILRRIAGDATPGPVQPYNVPLPNIQDSHRFPVGMGMNPAEDVPGHEVQKPTGSRGVAKKPVKH